MENTLWGHGHSKRDAYTINTHGQILVYMKQFLGREHINSLIEDWRKLINKCNIVEASITWVYCRFIIDSSVFEVEIHQTKELEFGMKIFIQSYDNIYVPFSVSLFICCFMFWSKMCSGCVLFLIERSVYVRIF